MGNTSAWVLSKMAFVFAGIAMLTAGGWHEAQATYSEKVAAWYGAILMVTGLLTALVEFGNGYGGRRLAYREAFKLYAVTGVVFLIVCLTHPGVSWLVAIVLTLLSGVCAIAVHNDRATYPQRTFVVVSQTAVFWGVALAVLQADNGITVTGLVICSVGLVARTSAAFWINRYKRRTMPSAVTR